MEQLKFPRGNMRNPNSVEGLNQHKLIDLGGLDRDDERARFVYMHFNCSLYLHIAHVGNYNVAYIETVNKF